MKQIRQLSSYTCVSTDDILRGIKFYFGKSNTKHISILPGSLLTAQFVCSQRITQLGYSLPHKHHENMACHWEVSGKRQGVGARASILRHSMLYNSGNMHIHSLQGQNMSNIRLLNVNLS